MLSIAQSSEAQTTKLDVAVQNPQMIDMQNLTSEQANATLVADRLVKAHIRKFSQTEMQALIDVLFFRRAGNAASQIDRLSKDNPVKGLAKVYLSEIGTAVEGNGSLALLQQGLTSKDPITQYYSHLFLAALNIHSGSLALGVELANEARNIALDLSQGNILLEPDEAVYNALSLMTTGYMVDGNLNEAVKIIIDMLNLAESSQIYVDSFSLLNKLSAAYELGGSTKTALIFAARMRDIEGDTEYENIIGDVTFGRLLVKTGNSLAGTQLLEPALLMNIDEEIKVEIYVVLSRAYAELGQYDRASQFAQKVLSNDVTLDVHQRAAVLGVLSDVAKSKGGFDVALNFKEEQIKLETQRLKAALETDRREASLTASMSQQVNEEKAKAKHSVLKFQKRMNVVAMMIGLILLISSIIVLVAYYRTKRQNVELELARERASVGEKAKTEFLAMINHEVRTPLNTIIPLSDHLARAVIIPEQKKILMHIASAGRDLFDQIENIFMMSGTVSAETEDLQDTDIHSLLLDVAKRAKEQINTNRKMRFQASPNLKAPVRIHSKTVRHVLSNILSNAVKFSDTDGTITVKAVYNGQNTLVFTVEDDGLGIDPEDVEGLMRPFEQVDSSIKRLHGGAGLGLSVANKLTKAMGGTLSLDTQIGMGTKVTISLPCETSVQFTAIDMAA